VAEVFVIVTACILLEILCHHLNYIPVYSFHVSQYVGCYHS